MLTPPEGHVAPETAPLQKKLHPARHAFSIPGVALFSVLIIGSFLFVSYYVRSLIETNQLAAVVTATLVDLANGDREGQKLGTLTINPLLIAAAQAKANDMAEKSYFAHTSPDGRDSWSWFKDVGYGFSYAGENLAVNFSDSEDVERAWMDSPTHRANILNGHFTEIGIATAVGEYKGKKTTFVVQMFGTPSRLPVAASARTPVTEPETAEEIAIATTEPVVEPTTVLGSSLPEETVAVVSPVEGAIVETTAPRYASLVDFFASSPQVLLRTIYIVCALLIVGALALTTELEFKRHHFRHMAAAVFLLALMGGLFTAADQLVFKPPVIGQASVLDSG